MKHNKRSLGRTCTALLLVALLSLSAAACSTQSAKDGGTLTGSRPGSMAPDYDYGSNSGELSEEAGGASDDQTIDLNRKIITTTKLRMETVDVRETMAKLVSKVADLGGYIQSQYETESAGSYYGEITVRVPAGNVSTFVDTAAAAGTIKENNVSISDVTADYTDTASRLKNAKVQEERLLLMFKEAETIDELLYIQSELDRLQERIEVYEGQIRLWDNLVDLATVTVYVYEEASLVDEDSTVPRYIPASTVWDRFTHGLQTSLVSFVNGISRFVIWVGYSFIQLIILILLAVLAYILIRRQRRRHKAKLMAQAQTEALYYGQTTYSPDAPNGVPYGQAPGAPMAPHAAATPETQEPQQPEPPQA